MGAFLATEAIEAIEATPLAHSETYAGRRRPFNQDRLTIRPHAVKRQAALHRACGAKLQRAINATYQRHGIRCCAGR
jgi:hypothetical protein